MDKVENIEFRNNSGLDFKDLSSEEWRSYEFPNGRIVNINGPLKLHVSDSGGHRLFDSAGECHYLPSGWIHLSWKVKNGHPHFDF